MNKTKTVIMGVTVLLLIAAIILVARFVMSSVFSATEAIKQMGEAPLPTEQPEEVWVAPTMGIDDTYILEQGIDNTEADGDFGIVREPDLDADEDLLSVPIEEASDDLPDLPSTAPVDDGTLEG